MRFGLLYEHQLPRPWGPDDESRVMHEALEQIAVADRVGFHRVWVVERHFLEEHAHSSAPGVFLGAVSQRTQRIRLGLGPLPLPSGYQHPARVAETAATLDLLAGGRVDLGTSESSTGAELGGFGVDRATTRHAWDESLGVVVRMMVEEPFTGHRGRTLDVPSRNVVPKPQQRPHPPLWLACPRRATIRDAAERGLGVLGLASVEPEEARDWVDEYRAIIASERCVPAGLHVTARFAVVLPLMVHAEEAEAIDRGIDGAHFGGYARAHHEVFGDHRPGDTNLWEEFLERREGVGFSREAIRPGVADESVPLGLRVLGEGLGSLRGAIGTPDQVRDLICRYEAAGVDEVVFTVQTGKTQHEHVLEALELFARTVMPEFAARAEDVEAARDAELATPVAQALARRPVPPPHDPEYAIAPLDDGRPAGVAKSGASAAAGQDPGSSGPGGAPRPPVHDEQGRGRRRTVVPARAAALRALAAARGEVALRAFVGRSDDRRLERTVGSDRGLRIVFAAMAGQFDPVGAAGFTGTIRYDLAGSDGRVRTWTVTCRLDGASARPGGTGEAAVTLKLGLADFVRVAAGELDPGRALLTGRLDIEGDFAVASRLGEMFGLS